MKENELKDLLVSIHEDKTTIDEAMKRLKQLPFVDMEYAKLDTHREIRTGFPEIIFCQGKSIQHIKGIISHMVEKNINILATRAMPEVYQALRSDIENMEYFPEARIIHIKNSDIHINKNKILVVTGGTSDIPVAEEAAVTAEKLGNIVERLYDVGVAGIHRLLYNQNKLNDSSVVIAVAGMEGALPSVIGGLTDKPVIAVPTSIGYGASFGGLAALLGMLNSCSSGTSVVNIDNGFGAGYFASVINRQIEKAYEK